MTVEAIYWGVGSVCAFGASAILFAVHQNFKKRAGFLPPDVVYEKNYLGEPDTSKILWKTPPLQGWSTQQIEEQNGFIFFFKYAAIAAGLFMAATAVVYGLGLK